jgi:hypothetical protein
MKELIETLNNCSPLRCTFYVVMGVIVFAVSCGAAVEIIDSICGVFKKLGKTKKTED